jgi:hypothetical protein
MLNCQFSLLALIKVFSISSLEAGLAIVIGLDLINMP